MFLFSIFNLDASPELLYWFSEQTLQPGPTVSLKCVATGNPPPQFTWKLDGFPVSFVLLALNLPCAVHSEKLFIVSMLVTFHHFHASHERREHLQQ